MTQMLSYTSPFLLFAAIILMMLVGLSLGMIGGGGSMMAVPILVYLGGLPAKSAITVSLPIVGITALAGAIVKARRGEFGGKAFLLFGVFGSLGAVVGSYFTPLVPEPVLLLIFALLMLGVGINMGIKGDDVKVLCNGHCHSVRCGVAGYGVGMLTGFLGAGGGFLLVPALRRFANQTMRLAAGTSLGIIALNSSVGFAARWDEMRDLGIFILTFTMSTLIGLVVGFRLSEKTENSMLEKLFAGMAITVAAFLVIANVGKL